MVFTLMEAMSDLILMNDTHSSINISSEPAFYSELIFADLKYRFRVTIMVDEGRSIGVGEHHFPD